ncbi:MAG TPA: hypothetical protein VGN94_15155 [Methylobacterium sp.]|nr:hypothetical protein [Methylobacterium sp.]
MRESFGRTPTFSALSMRDLESGACSSANRIRFQHKYGQGRMNAVFPAIPGEIGAPSLVGAKGPVGEPSLADAESPVGEPNLADAQGPVGAPSLAGVQGLGERGRKRSAIRVVVV